MDHRHIVFHGILFACEVLLVLARKKLATELNRSLNVLILPALPLDPSSDPNILLVHKTCVSLVRENESNTRPDVEFNPLNSQIIHFLIGSAEAGPGKKKAA